jgi:hypothetical protein
MAFIGTFSPDVPLTNRNIIINGAMQVAQRASSVTGITSQGYYTADRWQLAPSSAGTWTMNVESSGPTNTEFRSSANVICTTADSSLSAGDYFLFAQNIEGLNVQGIKKGTANAESITLSFWVKSSNTGTFVCEFRDVDNARHFAKTYTVNTANTWEKKTITAPPDTTGQFDNNNGNSLIVNFWLAAGTNYTSGTLPDTAWASLVTANRVVGQLNLANASGNYWAVTGIQLEIGEVATPYEMRSYAQEFALCQRYYYQSATISFFYYAGAGQSHSPIIFPVVMRTNPTVVYYPTQADLLAKTNAGNCTQDGTGIVSVAQVNGGPDTDSAFKTQQGVNMRVARTCTAEL